MDLLNLERAGAHPLFSGVGEQQVRRLLKNSEIRSFPPHSLLFIAGGRPDHLHLVLRGAVELYAGEPPRECTVLLMSKGDVFMPAATLFREPYLNSARTLTSATLLLVPADAAQREFAKSGRFALNVARVLAGHFRMAARTLIDLRSCSAAVRLGRFLLRLVQNAEGEVVRLPAPKGKLAARVGMNRETLSRALQTLAGQGLVVRGSQIIVRDREKIERFCKFDEVVPAGARGLDVHAL